MILESSVSRIQPVVSITNMDVTKRETLLLLPTPLHYLFILPMFHASMADKYITFLCALFLVLLEYDFLYVYVYFLV